MGAANRVIKNTGILYAKMGITVFISLYTTRLVLNALGASDFGIFNIVGGAIAMLGFLNAAMASATQRFMSHSEGAGDKEKQKKIFNISVILHFLIACLLGIILLVAGYFFFNGILNIEPSRLFAAKVVYGSLIVSTLFTVMTVPYDAVLNAHENMLYYAIIGILEALLKLAAALVIVAAGSDKLILYGILMASIPIITMVAMRIYCHRQYSECVFSPRHYWDKPLLAQMTSFAGWNFWGAAVSMVTFYGQGVIINMFFGTIVNAAQSIAAQINGQLNVFSTNMLKSLNPVIVKREGAGERQDMLAISLTGSKISFALLAFFAVPVIIEMPYVFTLWLKEIPDYTIIFCRLLLAKTLIEQLFAPLSTSISATGQIKHYQIMQSAIALLPFIITYILFRYGFEPWMLYVIYLIYTIGRYFGVTLYYARKLCDLPVKHFLINVVGKCLLMLFISFLIALIPYYLLYNGFVRLTSVIVCFWASFTSLFYLFGLNNEEQDKIHFLLRKIYKSNVAHE